jgi:hypothetical protein
VFLVKNERNGIRNFLKLAKVKRMRTFIMTAEKEIRRVRNNLPRFGKDDTSKRLHAAAGAELHNSLRRVSAR